MQRWTGLCNEGHERTPKTPSLSERTRTQRRRGRGAGVVLRLAAVRGATVAKYGDAKVYPTLTASLAFFVSLIGQVELPFTH
jgi:hypothetical protein